MGGGHTDLEAGFLQSERDQIQKVNELAEHDALRGGVLCTKIRQLFNESFNL